MQWSELDELRAPHSYPAVSILTSLQPHLPGNRVDPLHIRHLADQAARRVRAELGDRGGNEIVHRIDDALASLDWGSPPESIALFVAPGETHVLPLPFPVRERLEVDQQFALREIVNGLARTPRYRLLAVGEKPTRLFEGRGHELHETRSHGFPLFIEGAHGEPLASGGFATHTARPFAQLDAFFRVVDAALDELAHDDPLPLVLAGAVRDLAAFDEVTAHGSSVIGRITGNYEDARPDQLTARAVPLVSAYTASQRAAAVRSLEDAIGAHRAAIGVKAAWDAANEDRGRILLIEEDFVYPARVIGGHLEPAGDAESPEVLDDAGEALMERVLDHDGEVMVFDSGELGDHGPVALVLRF